MRFAVVSYADPMHPIANVRRLIHTHVRPLTWGKLCSPLNLLFLKPAETRQLEGLAAVLCCVLCRVREDGCR